MRKSLNIFQALFLLKRKNKKWNNSLIAKEIIRDSEYFVFLEQKNFL